MDISLFPPALQVMITLKGESDPSAADIFVKVGMINFRVGRLERSMPLLNKAIDIYREGGTEYESKLVSPLFVIGNIHKLLKQSKKARGVWSEAYELSTKYNGFKSDKILNKVHLVLQQLIENSDEEEEKEEEEEEEESVKKLPADTDTVPKRESTETGSNEVEQKKEKKENKKKTSPADTDIVEISTDDAEKKKEKSKKKPVSEQSEAAEDRNDNNVEVEKKKAKSKKKSSSAKSEKEEERNGNGDEVEKKKVKSKKREKSKKKKSSADTEASS